MNTKILLLFTAATLALGSPLRAADAPPAFAKPAGINKRVDVEEFDKLRTDKKNIILDVRTEKEFKAGHIPGAMNVDVNGADFEKKVAELDKNKTYLVHCAGGVRSAKAAKKMEGAGFKELYDLAPGFKGWEKAGKPIEK